jgi:hypothetical protein
MPKTYPDSPEAVALALMRHILKADPTILANLSNAPAATVLDLYVCCLDATTGARRISDKAIDKMLGRFPTGSTIQ